jgi:DNA-binding HxlR family transcriptional regulator
MTTKNQEEGEATCPAQTMLKLVSGKWKPEILRLATVHPLRFSSLLRELKGSNKQAIAAALKELEETGLLEKVIIKKKPLHIEYYLTKQGHSLIPVLQQLENIG